MDRLRALRAKRNQVAWKNAIEMIRDAARSGENLMPRIVDAVEARATVGEISDAMRTVFGEYQETVVV